MRRLESSTNNTNSTDGNKKREQELKWNEEREDLYERLAFVEEEAEDWKRELEVERERWRIELEEVRGDLMMERSRNAGGNGAADTNVAESNDGVNDADEDVNKVEDAATAEQEQQQQQQHQGESSSKDQEYIKTLEDELELVTEQLIEAETKLSRAQAELEEAAAAAVKVETTDTKDTELVMELEKRVNDLEVESESLREELRRVKEELELALEGEIMIDIISYMNITHHVVDC